MEMLSSLLRDRQRASVGGLELGPLLGRGSFGKVYQGVPGCMDDISGSSKPSTWVTAY